LIYYKEKINFLFVVCAKMRFPFIYLHVSMGHLFVKLIGVNLTPLVYNAAFLLAHDKDVQHWKSFGSTNLFNIKWTSWSFIALPTV